jgi:hypothetical protein
MKHVRLTSSPHKVSEVSDSAYVDHKRWGQVLEDVVPSEPVATPSTVYRKLGAEVSTKTATAPKKKTTDS